MPLPNPVKTNPLGQFADEALDATKSIATDTVKGAAALTSPKKILESILGKSSSNSQGESPGIEDMSGGQQMTQDPAQLAQKQQQQIAQKQTEDRQKADALLRLHRQRLQEEEAFFDQKTQQEKQEKQLEENQEKQEKQEEVVQLQHEKQKEDVLGSLIKQNEGSKEQKAWGAG